MTWWHSHPDAAQIVRSRWKESELLLIAQQEPCISIRNSELATIERVVQAFSPADLRDWKPRRSWFAAVLVCPGDQTQELAGIVQELRLDPRRFHFYLHRKSSRSSLAGWAQAGLPLNAVDEGISDWKSLHKLLGLDFNIQIVNDETNHTPN